MTDCYTVREEKLKAIVSHRLECVQQRVTEELVCAQKEDKGNYVCTQERDEGHTACGNWGTQTSSHCDSWSKNCCTWTPCKQLCQSFTWVCNAYVTVTTAVCNSWVWIENIVCLAQVWVSNWVCMAWAWITSAVCIAWDWVVNAVSYVIVEISYVVCKTPKWIVEILNTIEWSILSAISCLRRKDQPRNPLEKPGWRLVFEDDFDSGVLEPWWRDHSYTGAHYDDAHLAAGVIPKMYNDSSSIEFAPGTLRLKTDNVGKKVLDSRYPYNGGWFTIPYKAGLICWEAPLAPDQLYGYFEIRCKVPDSPEMWPAFWLVSHRSWPPEIDIFEFYSGPSNDDSFFESSTHWGVHVNGAHPKETKRHPVCRASRLYHIYACEWSPGEARFYVDNHLVRTATDGMSGFVDPMFIIVNTGPDTRTGHQAENGTYPNYLEVDYVRAYAKI